VWAKPTLPTGSCAPKGRQPAGQERDGPAKVAQAFSPPCVRGHGSARQGVLHRANDQAHGGVERDGELVAAKAEARRAALAEVFCEAMAICGEAKLTWLLLLMLPRCVTSTSGQ